MKNNQSPFVAGRLIADFTDVMETGANDGPTTVENVRPGVFMEFTDTWPSPEEVADNGEVRDGFLQIIAALPDDAALASMLDVIALAWPVQDGQGTLPKNQRDRSRDFVRRLKSLLSREKADQDGQNGPG